MHIEVKRYDNVHQEAMNFSLPWTHLPSEYLCAFLQPSAEIILLLLVELLVVTTSDLDIPQQLKQSETSDD